MIDTHRARKTKCVGVARRGRAAPCACACFMFLLPPSTSAEHEVDKCIHGGQNAPAVPAKSPQLSKACASSNGTACGHLAAKNATHSNFETTGLACSSSRNSVTRRCSTAACAARGSDCSSSGDGGCRCGAAGSSRCLALSTSNAPGRDAAAQGHKIRHQAFCAAAAAPGGQECSAAGNAAGSRSRPVSTSSVPGRDAAAWRQWWLWVQRCWWCCSPAASSSSRWRHGGQAATSEVGGGLCPEQAAREAAAAC